VADENTKHSVLQRRGTAEHVAVGNVVLEYLAPSFRTDDAIGIYRVTIAPESPGAGLHYHKRMIEMFEIQTGTLSMSLDGQSVEAKEGDFVLVVPGSIHGFSNRSKSPVTFTLSFTPALAREGFFEGLAELIATHRMNDQVAMQALSDKYDQFPVEGPDAWTHLR
jgi:mannose-6-phosphate isomerase-like protein (cupin superfamily)